MRAACGCAPSARRGPAAATARLLVELRLRCCGSSSPCAPKGPRPAGRVRPRPGHSGSGSGGKQVGRATSGGPGRWHADTSPRSATLLPPTRSSSPRAVGETPNVGAEVGETPQRAGSRCQAYLRPTNGAPYLPPDTARPRHPGPRAYPGCRSRPLSRPSATRGRGNAAAGRGNPERRAGGDLCSRGGVCQTREVAPAGSLGCARPELTPGPTSVPHGDRPDSWHRRRRGLVGGRDRGPEVQPPNSRRFAHARGHDRDTPDLGGGGGAIPHG